MPGLSPNERCPLCSFGELRVLHREPYGSAGLREYVLRSYDVTWKEWEDCLDGHDFVLALCGRCGLIFQVFTPDEEMQTRLYDIWVSPHASYQKYVERKRSRLVLNEVAGGIATGLGLLNVPAAEARALDFGAGWGIASDLMRPMVSECLVGEISKARIAKLEERGHRCVDVRDIDDSSLDYIYTEQVFEHLVGVGDWLSLLVRKLRVDGVLRIGVPNGAGIRYVLGRRPWLPSKPRRWSLNPVAPLEHVNCFNAATLVSVADQFGLRSLAPNVNNVSNALRNLPVSLQVIAESSAFRVTGRKLPLQQFFRRVR